MMTASLPCNSGQSDFMELATVRAWKPGTSHLGIRTCSNRSDPTIRVRRVAHGCLDCASGFAELGLCRPREVSDPSYEPNTKQCSIELLQSIIYHGLDPILQFDAWLDIQSFFSMR